MKKAILTIISVVILVTLLLWLTNSRDNYEELIPEYTEKDGSKLLRPFK